jgi:cold shock CspA family protein
MADEKMSGRVMRVFVQRGFGFVMGEDGISRFLHAKDVKPRVAFDKMHEGQAVRFKSMDLTKDGAEPASKGNGLRAVEIEVIDGGS